ncbi:ATP-binding protein [Roseibium marinum]|uniref:histidine kinase n=1 Tax=Roseibium marinum TaxID=281252 RepID=A0A2S3V4A1_9HYPH|nr:ATP-binding protein [Roseibium marinum]POF34603.1 PAS domain S-box-containing protein [Roseibium marinum]
MDNQTQSFLELSAMDDLVQLVADKRAAWLWSADGARILWANAAGASFFSASAVSDLAGLSSLERSPARPHIARIAQSGPTDKFSIDRLRFYRGLRVMLLTCQCRRVELESGETAALIVCGDKGLVSTREPVPAFAHLLTGAGTTVFLTSGGAVEERLGELQGAPEDPDLPQDQKALFGPLELDGGFHEGVVLEVSSGRRLIVLDNAPLADEMPEEPDATDSDVAPHAPDPVLSATVSDDIADEPEETGSGASEDAGAREASEEDIAADNTSSGTFAEEAGPTSDAVDDREREHTGDDEQEGAPGPDSAAGIENEPRLPSAETADEDQPFDQGTREEIPAIVPNTADESEHVAGSDNAAPHGETEEDAGLDAGSEVAAEEDGLRAAADLSEQQPVAAEDEVFVFRPRRRPVRFAWKMDIDQRFTFLSDEFAEVLGPEATDIVGLTWEEVSAKFELDPRGNIARALDRRDTWSGKTVSWPVSGAPLRIPVDMAALPAFDRNRKFEGYRGFGVCRTADAVEVKDILLSPALAAFDETFAAEPEAEDPLSDNGGDETAEETGIAEPDLETGTDETPVDEDVAGTAGSEPHTVGPTNESPDTEAPDETLDEEEGIEDESVSEVHTPSAETSSAEAAAQEAADAPKDSLADLKPAQPDSFGGKTFLGASAAALVGSLARFTGTPASKQTGRQVEEASKPRQPEENAEDNEDTRRVAASLDDKLKALETGTTHSDTAASAGTEAAAVDAAGNEDPDGDAEENDAAADTSVPDLSESEVSTKEAAPSAEEGPEEAPDGEERRPAGDEPTGIAGPAALEPAEIESAVRSLAKNYDLAKKKSRDLFDEEYAISSGTSTSAQEQDNGSAGTEVAAGTPVEDAVEDEPFEPVPPLEDAHFDIIEEDGRRIEEVAAELDTDGGSTDEREFYEETAAFVEEETEDAPEPEKPTGQVIPLATARPRVVPVDTSGLSRPERQAFRKIAEALGARLEGDLVDFEGSDGAEIDDLPPEEPEAGPIDPSLLDRLPIGIAVVHGREVLYANKVLLGMLGYRSVATLCEAGGLEALFIDDTEDLPDAVGMDGEVDESMKLRLAGGGVLTVDAHMHSVPWNGSHGLMISITERQVKQAPVAAAPQAAPNFFAEVRSELESARGQIAEMDTILETATDGVLVLDQIGNILKVNGSAEALFSANRSDMIGAPFTEFLAPESHRAAADYLDGLTRNGVASILNDGREVLGKVPSGGLIPLFMTIGRITNNKDDAKYCAVLRDITQWKTAEEELTQAKRQAENASSQKSDFLAKISHEIRTPLNAIIGFSEVMMEERFGPIGNDRYKDYLKDIRTSGSHIMSLINDLLDLSKIEAGKLDLKFSAVSTNDVINECVALMQPQANRERVIIRASLPDSVPDVVADPRSLRQIVLNLLSNAIKYNKSGGQVILSTALESNGEVALRVRDTGTGMTAKQLAAALEPFRQLHTASRGGGTGLGLPLTKALVEANRASFHIDSTPDQGTLVEIVFPTQRVLSE